MHYCTCANLCLSSAACVAIASFEAKPTYWCAATLYQALPIGYDQPWKKAVVHAIGRVH
jgi:hypothetical protein